MSIGTGLAIAGIWVGVAVAAFSGTGHMGDIAGGATFATMAVALFGCIAGK